MGQGTQLRNGTRNTVGKWDKAQEWGNGMRHRNGKWNEVQKWGKVRSTVVGDDAGSELNTDTLK